ncbi:glycosyl transferase [Paraclostridium bifermentans]|uniref:glycosyltransferase n=1 Tax=Paraclostridium bifermentans TaxID=1490 RepID=UPI0021C39FB0|nr:glycosyltransferase [Paraclostridium bifermentans]GKZ04398.1 glycosyl transferase [Paraclostridium bifermentans]GKZ06788.1 glycosyl transferase [Paraclostridium bifermentans]GKZ11300.1 glycosyl transferase [Paraclostridium bifermentans]
MKILNIVYSLEPRGGVEVIISNLFYLLKEKNIDCNYILLSDIYEGNGKSIEESGSEITKIKEYYKHRFKGKYKLYKILKQNLKYDAIHINLTCGSDILIVIISYIAGFRNITTHAHTNRGNRYLFLIVKSILYLLASNQVACSQQALDCFYFKKGKKNTILPNFFDVNRFKYNKNIREKIRRHYNIENKKVLGMVGRLENIKNHDFTLKVLKEVVKYESDIVLLIIGEGSLKEKLKSTMIEYGLQDNVIFLGNITTIECMYNAMDILLLPSISEGLGLVLVEAQYSGLKCIASNRVSRETNISKNIEYLEIENEKDIEKWAKKNFGNRQLI